ncbi:hypothetical protein Dform_00858 [Dehalogenimonas formicexedens]|uniref:Uncharacterized protein n=1 Tax=Dehalogenimonas formicexedens TaxID=1839801 RepID=A0A1P8F6W5_9CHLR|nr:hypothetical protein [Dehalogenimonas formicexedens]APV44203.1 hypothetical protein Dform_00858 [Dehalogenimonas formicexedens]
MNPSNQYRLDEREIKQIAAALAAAQAQAEKVGRIDDAGRCYTLRLRLMAPGNAAAKKNAAPTMPVQGPKLAAGVV